jgi:hypothetical protein
MNSKPLAELLKELEQEMLRLGYTEGSMKFYRRRWHMLLLFAQECGETYFDPTPAPFARYAFTSSWCKSYLYP